MPHIARPLSVVLGCASFLFCAVPAEAKNIFEIIFGPPAGTHTKRAHRVRHAGRVVHPRAVVIAHRPSRLENSRGRHARRATPTQVDVSQPALRPGAPQRIEPARVMTDAEMIESIMTDPTLRRGDVVEFPDGPRVYRGKGRFSSHRVSDFEQVLQPPTKGGPDRS